MQETLEAMAGILALLRIQQQNLSQICDEMQELVGGFAEAHPDDTDLTTAVERAQEFLDTVTSGITGTEGITTKSDETLH